MDYQLRDRRRRKNSFLRRPVRLVAAVGVGALAVPASPLRAASNSDVTFSTIATNGYGTDDLNSNGIIRDNLVTIDGYQYAAYYTYNSAASGTIEIARRASGSNTWTYLNTGITVTAGQNNVSTDSIITNGIDDHDIVAIGVDGNGDLQLSWGMHNHTLNYAISNTPVTGTSAAFSTTTFTTQTAANNPTLFSQLGSVDQVTYPEFYYEPGANGQPNGNLVFDYRDAASASGGGSGNGNTYFATYNAATSSFTTPHEVLDGGLTSVNGYQNSLVYDSKGNLLMTWTWRATSAYQTNENIMIAQSPDNGATWYQQGGTTQYKLPIVQSVPSPNPSGVTANQVGQVIDDIPQNSSLINQTTMAVDANSNPFIATWYTPDGTASESPSATNNPNRQYMLVYYTGTQWKTSQITDRTNDASFDTSGDDVRDLARPLVLIDQEGRVLVVTRSEDSGVIGGAFNSSLAGNDIVVYWNTVASLDSADPAAWQSITLDTANMGEWEPTYDTLLWNSTNELDLFYQPVGLSGESASDVEVLQWNEQAYFASIPEPSGLGAVAATAMLLVRRRRASRRSR